MQPVTTSMGDLVSTVHGGRLAGAPLVRRSLEAVRRHLGMDVAYISELTEDESVFREVDAPGLEHLLAAGDRRPLDQVYCRHILAGRLPELMPDTGLEPLAAAMPITAQAPIGSHVSVPIRLPGGEVYGMFCCLGAAPRPGLNERDLHIVRAFAGLVAEEIEREGALERDRAAKVRALREVLAADGLSIVLQPIVTLRDGTVTGYEALARFAADPPRAPDRWFADAAEAGLGAEMELAAVALALARLPDVPHPLTLSVNVSPSTVLDDALAPLLAAAPPDRLVLELTEHEGVSDYDVLIARLERLREGGVALAVDDAGAGFSSLQHILRLRPDYIKLDMSLVRHVDVDPARQALAAAMLLFARNTGAVLVAEGVETVSECDALRSLGVTRGQGYLFGRPQATLDAGARAASAA